MIQYTYLNHLKKENLIVPEEAEFDKVTKYYSNVLADENN